MFCAFAIWRYSILFIRHSFAVCTRLAWRVFERSDCSLWIFELSFDIYFPWNLFLAISEPLFVIIRLLCSGVGGSVSVVALVLVGPAQVGAGSWNLP